MSTLADQQQQLRAAILQGHGEAPHGLLTTSAGRPALLHIYQHAYASRLKAALRDNCGVLPRLMGDEAFDALAEAYLQAHPSRHRSIRWFGDQLPAFMEAHEELVPHGAMTDMARMEWALRAAFDGAALPPLQATQLAALRPADWDTLVLRFQPTVQWLPLSWAIEPAWRALQVDEAAEEPALDEPEPLDHLLLVWRPALDTRWRAIGHRDGIDAALLVAAMQGRPFGHLCALAAERLGEAGGPAAAVGALQQWLADGMLAA
ncbi:MAG: hypothetical protein RLZZ618_3299 [Pseudomonadota bacterium]|jgi:hypothetical protein